jgi:anthranilate synthase/aminodeoxychorismate synthase-like glutamine amidotransferase
LAAVILVLDNYDSFTYNLVQYLGELGAEPVVYRNDAITVEAAVALEPAAAVISPGPGIPEQAGITIPLIRALAGRCPVLGVCLGHQGLAAAFGGRVVRADRLMHGKTGLVAHEGDALFAGIPSPLPAMRYHSLIAERASLPAELAITAWSHDRPHGDEIMALRHRSLPLFGVQFHPESIGTEDGKVLLENFLRLAGAHV